jgi:K+-sensing histidine kinase KdpD
MMRERFEARLTSAHLKLEMKIERPFRCSIDSNTLEHILFNLIDNAAKYATGSEPAMVSIETATQSNGFVINVGGNESGGPYTGKNTFLLTEIPKSKMARTANTLQIG